MEKREILLDVKVNQGQTEDDINKLTKSLVFLNAEQKDLLAINKSLEKSGEVLSSQYIENTKTIEKNKNEIAKQTAERKVLVKTLDLENNSLGLLEASSKRLTEERRNLNLSTKEGIDRLKQINNELSDNKDAIDKAKGATGSWKDSIDSVVPGFKGMVDGIEKGTKASIAFIATPLGLFLSGIAVLLGSVISYFKNTGDGADKLTEILSGVSAAGKVLMDRFSSLGRIIVEAFEDPKQALLDFVQIIKDQFINRIEGSLELIPKLGQAMTLVFKGEFSAAAEVAVDALGKVTLGVEGLSGKIKNLADEVVKESAAAMEMARALDALEDREKKYELQASRTTLRIKELRAEAKDRSKSELERAALLEKAFDMEVAQASKLESIRRGQLDQVLKEIDTRSVLDRKKGESSESFIIRLIDEGRITDEQRDKAIAAVKALDEAKGQSLVLQEQIQSQINALYDKDKDAKEKSENAKTQAEKKALDERTKAYNEYWNKRVKDAEANNAEMDKKALDDFNKEQKRIELREKRLVDSLNFIGKKNESARVAANIISKKDALKQILIDSKTAAMAAYKALAGIPVVGPIIGAIAAAGALAFGVAQAAAVSGVTFERGGSVDDKIGRGRGRGFTIKGRDHSQGGTEFRGSDGSRFVAQREEGMFILNREAHRDFINEQSARNIKHGGRSWSPSYGTKSFELGGQFIQAQEQVGSLSSADIVDIVSATVASMPRPVVLVEDINTGQARVANVIDKATFS